MTCCQVLTDGANVGSFAAQVVESESCFGKLRKRETWVLLVVLLLMIKSIKVTKWKAIVT